MIKSFRDAETERMYREGNSKRFPSTIAGVAVRKLGYIQAANKLMDLASPSGNRLESLHGDRKGQHSIRVNDQYRICFVWTDDGAENVELTDYH